MCITDYDSLTDEEKDLCHFIFDTERSADDTIICVRARKQLAGMNFDKLAGKGGGNLPPIE